LHRLFSALVFSRFALRDPSGQTTSRQRRGAECRESSFGTQEELRPSEHTAEESEQRPHDPARDSRGPEDESGASMRPDAEAAEVAKQSDVILIGEIPQRQRPLV